MKPLDVTSTSEYSIFKFNIIIYNIQLLGFLLALWMWTNMHLPI